MTNSNDWKVSNPSCIHSAYSDIPCKLLFIIHGNAMFYLSNRDAICDHSRLESECDSNIYVYIIIKNNYQYGQLYTFSTEFSTRYFTLYFVTF